VGRYHSALVWTLRVLALVALIGALIGAQALISNGPLGGDASVVGYAAIAEFQIILFALASAELLARHGDQSRFRLPGGALAWTMRSVAIALLFLGAPTVVGIVRAQFSIFSLDQLVFGLGSLFTAPVLLLSLAEVLSPIVRQPHQLGTAS
jgi:hypothetical protein